MKISSFLFTLMLLTSVAIAQNKALLIGIGNYEPSTGWRSIGSSNDIIILKKAIPSSFKITTLTNEKATYLNIVNAINQLINDCNKGDTVLIHFSGHGQQMLTDDPNEPDFLDEAIVPYDAPMKKSKSYNGERHITDNQFGILLQKLRKKVGTNGLVVATIDACYSGSMDRDGDDELENDSIVYRGGANFFGSNMISQDSIDNINATRMTPSEPIEKISGGADVVLISACMSYLITKEITIDGVNYGPLSYAMSQSFATANFHNLESWINGVKTSTKKFNSNPEIRTTCDYLHKNVPNKNPQQNYSSAQTTRSQDSENEGFPYIYLIIGIVIVSSIAWIISRKK
ncbi:MAG: caspase family protein [Bacteroidales bacterium]|nr:caspase family protein [Bacteroidales bacterium]